MKTERESTRQGVVPMVSASSSRGTPLADPITHERIARQAYQIFEASGHQHGRDVEFWLEAERQLRAKLER